MRKAISPKRLAALAAVTVSVLAIAGCVVITGPVDITQQSGVGPMRVTFTICGSDTDTANHPGCPDTGNSSQAPGDGQEGQVLVAFRVPAGVNGPDSFATTSGVPLAFTRSPSYQSQLQELVPPPAGQRWLGYISDRHTHVRGPNGTPPEQATISVDFALPQGSNGAPFQGPFQVRPVVGARPASDDTQAARPVSCDNVFGGPFSATGAGTDCIDSPSESDTATNLSQASRDLGIIGAITIGSTGKTASVPFSARYAGAADPASSFQLSATTDLKGTTATPSVATLTPGSDTNNNVNVAVKVPKTAKAGTYRITLTARAANGQVRTGTSNLQVRDKQPPTAKSLKLSPSSFRPLASPASIAKVARRTRVSFRLSEAGKVKFTVQRCTKLKGKKCKRYRTAKGSFSYTAKSGANRFRFTGYVGGRKLRRGTYRLVGVPTDKSKNKGKAVRAAFKIR